MFGLNVLDLIYYYTDFITYLNHSLLDDFLIWTDRQDKNFKKNCFTKSGKLFKEVDNILKSCKINLPGTETILKKNKVPQHGFVIRVERIAKGSSIVKALISSSNKNNNMEWFSVQKWELYNKTNSSELNIILPIYESSWTRKYLTWTFVLITFNWSKQPQWK